MRLYNASNPLKVVSARFFGQLDPAGFVAIDDVDVSCFSDEFGDCACNEGYSLSSDGKSCSLDPVDPEPIKPSLIATCRASSTCAQSADCELGDEVPVCVAGTGYRNRACALCNWETATYIYDGLCTATPLPNDMVSTCSLPSPELQAACQSSTV